MGGPRRRPRPTFLIWAHLGVVLVEALPDLQRRVEVRRGEEGRGEEESGGRNRQANLAGTLEAVLGAVLIDRGQKVAWYLVLRWLGSRIEAIGETGAPRDAKSALQEKAQQTGLPLPEYRVVEEEGESHNRRYLTEVWLDGKLAGQGRGRRKVDAEKSAAEQALSEWETVYPSA